MLTLEQGKLLEGKVESLIGMVKSLYAERDALKDTLQKKEKQIEELNNKVFSYEAEQAKIEERVVNALNQLDIFQNSVAHAKTLLSNASALDTLSNDDESESNSVQENDEKNYFSEEKEQKEDADKQMDIF